MTEIIHLVAELLARNSISATHWNWFPEIAEISIFRQRIVRIRIHICICTILYLNIYIVQQICKIRVKWWQGAEFVFVNKNEDFDFQDVSHIHAVHGSSAAWMRFCQVILNIGHPTVGCNYSIFCCKFEHVGCNSSRWGFWNFVINQYSAFIWIICQIVLLSLSTV